MLLHFGSGSPPELFYYHAAGEGHMKTKMNRPAGGFPALRIESPPSTPFHLGLQVMLSPKAGGFHGSRTQRKLVEMLEI
jgi:hypothetical protein